MQSSSSYKPIILSHSNQITTGTVPLSSSKSESNRALIIQALGNEEITLSNLAEARDTQTMMRLLKSNEETLDVLDAGTTMRFLTAYCTATNRKTILTGTPRMKERPIKILVDALRDLGGNIEYVENEGYPPIQIKSFEQKTVTTSIQGNVSSQYISALLMVAPNLPLGLELHLEGEVASRPYIEMTLQLMSRFGIDYTWEGNVIRIQKQNYKSGNYTIESDWSGASYWYSIAALSQSTDMKILGLRKDSLQGDSVLTEFMDQLGVVSTFEDDGVLLQKGTTQKYFEYDFSHCPDLAQTIAVICAAKGVEAKLTGLESLRIKETDRIAAIQTELSKFGIKVEVIGDEAINIPSQTIQFSEDVCVNTYEDHRMAMAFAPLALLAQIKIDDPEVVNKSYPSFWKHLELVGFQF